MEQNDCLIFKSILGNIGKIDELVHVLHLHGNLIGKLYDKPDSEFTQLGKELQKLGENLSLLSESALSAFDSEARTASEATCLKDINLSGKLHDRDGLAKEIANYAIDDLLPVIKKVAKRYVKVA